MIIKDIPTNKIINSMPFTNDLASADDALAASFPVEFVDLSVV